MVKEKLIPMGNYVCIKEVGTCVLCRIYSLTRIEYQTALSSGKLSCLSYVQAISSNGHRENYIGETDEYKKYFKRVG